MARKDNTKLNDVWRTPDELLDLLGHIDVDPCAGIDTEIGDINYTEEDDGLSKEWSGRVFVNPPFANKSAWLQKAVEEQSNTEVIFVLTPDSTDTISWWHKYIAAEADYIWFSEGRISYIVPEIHADKFDNYDAGQMANSPAFGTAISIFGEPEQKTLERLDKNGQLLKTVNI